MNRAPAKQRFIDGLSAIRDEIGSLDASLNINLITRYEMSEATKALYALSPAVRPRSCAPVTSACDGCWRWFR